MQRQKPRPTKHDDPVKIDATPEQVAKSLFKWEAKTPIPMALPPAQRRPTAQVLIRSD